MRGNVDHDAHSLEGLKEIPLPDPIPYTPQTAGWFLIGALALLAIGYGLWRLARHYAANRYRRTALKELAEIESRIGKADERHRALAAIPALLKRTALVAAGRQAVAALSDRAWWEFLDRTCAPGGFSNGPGRLLTLFSYAEPSQLAAVPESEVRDLMRLVRRWIEGHHAHL